MGLFDTINFDAGIIPKSKKLPKAEKGFFESEEWLQDWQTKDLVCAMRVYHITNKGLFEQHYKEVKKPTKEYKAELAQWEEDYKDKPSAWRDILKPRKTKSVPDRLIKVNHHGLIRVYNIKSFGGAAYSVEYQLKFTDGKLAKITLVKVSKHNPPKLSAKLKKRIREAAKKEIVENPW